MKEIESVMTYESLPRPACVMARIFKTIEHGTPKAGRFWLPWHYKTNTNIKTIKLSFHKHKVINPNQQHPQGEYQT